MAHLPVRLQRKIERLKIVNFEEGVGTQHNSIIMTTMRDLMQDCVTDLAAVQVATMVHRLGGGPDMRLVSKHCKEVSELTSDITLSARLFEVKNRVSNRLSNRIGVGSSHPSEDVETFLGKFPLITTLTVKEPPHSNDSKQSWWRFGRYRWYRVSLPRVSLEPMTRHAPDMQSLVFNGSPSSPYRLRLGRHLPEVGKFSSLTNLEFSRCYLGGKRFGYMIEDLVNLKSLKITDCRHYDRSRLVIYNLSLQSLSCVDTGCWMLVVAPKLQFAIIRGEDIRRLDMQDCTELHSLVVDYRILKNMVKHTPNLTELLPCLLKLQLTSTSGKVQVTDMATVALIRVIGSELESVDIKACPMLQTIKIEEDGFVCDIHTDLQGKDTTWTP